MDNNLVEFEWDENKNIKNIKKHKVSFYLAQKVFFDKERYITIDKKHSTEIEKRYYCFGIVNEKILTVRFTIRNNKIRIFGAGFWREGKARYEKRKIY